MNKISIAAIAATFALGVTACGQDKKPAEAAKIAAKPEPNKAEKPEVPKEEAAPADLKAITLGAIEAYNKGDFDAALANVDEGIEWHYIGKPDVIKGKEGVKAAWNDWRASFPDSQLAIKQLFVSGDTVAAHVIATGTHKGEFQGTAPTDKPIGIEMMLVMENRNGKSTKWTEYVNFLAVPSQIGAGPKGAPPIPVVEAPTEPIIIEGEANPANEEIVKSWLAVFSNQDADFPAEIDKHLTADATHWNTGTGEKKEGSENAKKEIPKMLEAFANRKVQVDTILSAGDYVLARGRWSGKHVGKLGKIKASNKEFSVDFSELYRIQDGKIAESWEYNNQHQFLTQIGVIPPPAAEEKLAQK